MKLPAMLRRDTAALLDRARAAFAAAEARIAELGEERSAMLLSDSGFDAVWNVEKLIAEQTAVARTRADQIRALEEQLRREHLAEVERQRAAAITGLERKFAAREALAAEVEEKARSFAAAWLELLDSRAAALADWPEAFPRPRQDDLRSRVDRECPWFLFGLGKPTAISGCRIPAPSNEGLGVTGIVPKGIAGAIEEEHANLLHRLRSLPLPDVEHLEAA